MIMHLLSVASLLLSSSMVSSELLVHFAGSRIPGGTVGCEGVDEISRPELATVALICTNDATMGFYDVQQNYLEQFTPIGEFLDQMADWTTPTTGVDDGDDGHDRRKLQFCPPEFPQYCESDNLVVQSNCCYFWGDHCTYCNFGGSSGSRRRERRALAARKLSNEFDHASTTTTTNTTEMMAMIDGYVVSHMDSMRTMCAHAFRVWIQADPVREECFGPAEDAIVHLIDLE